MPPAFPVVTAAWAKAHGPESSVFLLSFSFPGATAYREAPLSLPECASARIACRSSIAAAAAAGAVAAAALLLFLGNEEREFILGACRVSSLSAAAEVAYSSGAGTVMSLTGNAATCPLRCKLLSSGRNDSASADPSSGGGGGCVWCSAEDTAKETAWSSKAHRVSQDCTESVNTAYGVELSVAGVYGVCCLFVPQQGCQCCTKAADYWSNSRWVEATDVTRRRKNKREYQ